MLYLFFVCLTNIERDSRVGAVLREQNALPHKGCTPIPLTAKDAIENGGAGRAAKGENPSLSLAREERETINPTFSICCRATTLWLYQSPSLCLFFLFNFPLLFHHLPIKPHLQARVCILDYLMYLVKFFQIITTWLEGYICYPATKNAT